MLIKLFKLSEGDHKTDLYIFTTLSDEKDIRAFRNYTDHGGMPYEDFQRVAKDGMLTEVREIDQVHPEALSHLPFGTDEMDDFEMSIEEWLGQSHHPRLGE